MQSTTSESTVTLSILQAFQKVLSLDEKPISLHEPSFGGKERQYVTQCLDTGWVSSVGKFVERFERDLADCTGLEYAVATINGTAALHMCLQLVDVQPNDEVLVPSLAFVATANAVIYCRAIPHFVDSEEVTLGMSPGKLKAYLDATAEIHTDGCINRFTKRRIKAVVPVHTFGHPVDLDPLVEICEQYHLELVEDAAESLGSFYKNKHTGNFGKVSALSFNGNKVITTGGGGAIVTNDPILAQRAKHLTTTAKMPHSWKYVHDEVGYNYRLPNLNAALGCAQLEQLPRFLEQKRMLAQRYQRAFADIPGVCFFVEPPFARSNYWLNVLLLDDVYASQRDNVLRETNAQGIMTRPVWSLLHRLPMYQECPKMDLSTAENLEQRIINIPSSANLI